MDWSKPIDQYCERLDGSWLSEPLNLVSNLAFFLAAFFAYRFARRTYGDAVPMAVKVALALIVMIGVGSSLFHSLATFWAMLTDVIPIGMFLMFYLGLYMRSLLGWSWGKVTAGLVAFLALTFILGQTVDREAVNGSQNYFGAWVSLMLMSFGQRPRNATSANLYLFACLAFALSLSFRAVDIRICDAFPWGTHFLWHSFNGLTIYLVFRALIQGDQGPQPTSRS